MISYGKNRYDDILSSHVVETDDILFFDLIQSKRVGYCFNLLIQLNRRDTVF